MDTSNAGVKKRAYNIFEILKKDYPDAKPLLRFEGAFELLVATILAAQCTDKRVNDVTPALFEKFPDPARMAIAGRGELESIIRSTGFYKNKAKSLIGASNALMEKFGGEVPGRIEDLVSIPGVGRKTANVVAGACFGVPAIIVDTHLKRVAGRLSIAASQNPDVIEKELRAIIAEKDCTRFSHTINFHGRYVCRAAKPLCPECRVAHLCPYPDKTSHA
jgi:endonuclease III